MDATGSGIIGDPSTDPVVTVARAIGSNGEVALRRRGDGPNAVWELIINGTFAMDSSETVSERMLARVALSHHARAGRSPGAVLVCGLGLGYTALGLLRGPVDQVHVVEREQVLIDWARAGLTPTLASVVGDQRTRLHVADAATFLSALPAGVPAAWQAILLDVDNGPDFLLHESNAWLYERGGLATCWSRLAPGGILAIWCQGRSAELHAELVRLDPDAAVVEVPILREGHSIDYAIHLARRPESRAGSGEGRS
ncbi:MAG: hypothetical protein L0G99_13105 [Propionibacteriales bacterium]|nr:hypothetical protein [Propionibacteriales bacterium]